MAYITQKRVSFSPLDLESRSPALRIVAVAFGTLVLAISSQIAVPMIPVPITLQTLVVPLIGGSRWRRWWYPAFCRSNRWISRLVSNYRSTHRLSRGTRLERQKPGACFCIVRRSQPALPRPWCNLAFSADRR